MPKDSESLMISGMLTLVSFPTPTPTPAPCCSVKRIQFSFSALSGCFVKPRQAAPRGGYGYLACRYMQSINTLGSLGMTDIITL